MTGALLGTAGWLAWPRSGEGKMQEVEGMGER